MIRAAAIQLTVASDVNSALAQAGELIAHAVAGGAALVVLPERFAQWDEIHASDRARLESAHVERWLADQARAHAIHLVGGSIVEQSAPGLKPFNTSMLFGPEGDCIARYRKIHLFDATVDGVIHGESETIDAGQSPVCIETPLGAIGMSVCYDLRFPELYRTLADQGMRIAAIPAGFTRVTGQAHWEVLVRARAIENQCFVVASGMTGRTSPARDFHGNSMIVDPWGTVLARLEAGAGVVLADLDMTLLDEVRRRLPALRNRRLTSRQATVLA